MRIGSLSRKAVIAVLVGCTAYVACFKVGSRRVDYSPTAEDLIRDGPKFGVVDTEELGSSAGIIGLPEAGGVRKSDEFFEYLFKGKDGERWYFLINAADKTFLPGADGKVKYVEDVPIRMGESEGGLLGFLAGDVSSIIPEHCKQPGIEYHAINIGEKVEGVFKALKDALRHGSGSGEEGSQDMVEACKKSIVDMVTSVCLLNEEKGVDEIKAAAGAAANTVVGAIGDALTMFSYSTFKGGDEHMEGVMGRVKEVDVDLFGNDGGGVPGSSIRGVANGEFDYPFVCIAVGVLRFISSIALKFSDSIWDIPDSSEGMVGIDKEKACKIEKLLLAFEIASARGVGAIKTKYGYDGTKRGRLSKFARNTDVQEMIEKAKIEVLDVVEEEIIKDCKAKILEIDEGLGLQSKYVSDKLEQGLKTLNKRVCVLEQGPASSVDGNIIDKKLQDIYAKLLKSINDLDTRSSIMARRVEVLDRIVSGFRMASAPVADLPLAEKYRQRKEERGASKQEQLILTTRDSDLPPPQYSVPRGDTNPLVGGMRDGQGQLYRRVGETPQQQNPQQRGSGGSNSVLASTSQSSGDKPTYRPRFDRHDKGDD